MVHRGIGGRTNVWGEGRRRNRVKQDFRKGSGLGHTHVTESSLRFCLGWAHPGISNTKHGPSAEQAPRKYLLAGPWGPGRGEVCRMGRWAGRRGWRSRNEAAVGMKDNTVTMKDNTPEWWKAPSLEPT